MCRLCKDIGTRLTIKRPLNETETRKYLTEIAGIIGKGASPSHFKAILDQILGTEMGATDPELDAVWEDRRSDGRR